MTLPVWPYRVLRPSKLPTPMLAHQVQSSGPTISGLTQDASTDAGGDWVYPLANVRLRGPRELAWWEAWATYLDGGVNEFIMPIPSLRTAPRPSVGGVLALPGSPAASDDPFGQDPSFGAPLMLASFEANAALRATTIIVEMDRGGALHGGERLSVNHSSWGWRLYRLGQVTRVDSAHYSCKVRPPLRQAVLANDPIEFDVPRCVMRLDPSNTGDMGPGSAFGEFDQVSAGFRESFLGAG